MTHELKIWPEYYKAITSGIKTFELRERVAGREFNVGDRLELREWDPEIKLYTENVVTVMVPYIVRLENMDVMSIRLVNIIKVR